MAVSPIRLAGYQGQGSILTGALRQLAVQLQDSGWGLPVDCEDDVTAAQEKASALFDSVEQGERHICYMASGYLSARVPELAVLDLPFSVSDRAAALAALPVGALFLLAAFFLGVLRGGARLGRLIAVTADLLSHGAAMRCC